MAGLLPVEELKGGEYIKLPEGLFLVDSVERKSGTGQFSSIYHLKLIKLENRHHYDKRMNPDEKVEIIDVEIVPMVFLYQEGNEYVFMHPETYEQYYINGSMLGNYAKFLKENDEVNIILYEGQPIAVEVPKEVRVKVAQTSEQKTSGGHEGNTWKPAILENGIEIMVPQFIKPGDEIILDPEKLEYLKRV